MANTWCTGDCVWMGPELDRLKKENLGLRDLVKRLADELERFCDGGCKRDEVLREARELKDIDKKNCDAFCPRVATLEKMLKKAVQDKRETMEENTRLREEPDRVREINDNDETR